jgi:hypothetical protein
MSDGLIPDSDHVRTRARWWSAGLLLLTMLVPATGDAEVAATTTTVIMRSGLHSFFEGHSPFLTVAEVGASSASSTVRIEFRDDADSLIASAGGTLRRGQPVRLRTPIKAGRGLVQVRALIRITSFTDAGSVPVAVFEDLGPDWLVARIGVCGPPDQRGGGQEFCPGFYLTTQQD